MGLKEGIKVHVDTAYTQCCWCIPRLPEAAQFKKWLPKHRHLIFGHFIYGLFLVFTTASTGTSLYRRCTANEAIFIIIILLVTSVCTGIPKMLANGIKGVGPAILSFLIMFATGISLHQKPLVCGFSGSKRGRAKQVQANMWGLVVSLQVVCILFTILLYLAWHLKHKDEKYRAEHADDSDAESNEDSMQGSPASIRWRTTDDPDDMAGAQRACSNQV